MATIRIVVDKKGHCDWDCQLRSHNNERETTCDCEMLWDDCGTPAEDCPGPGLYRMVSEEKIQELWIAIHWGIEFSMLGNKINWDRYIVDTLNSLGLGKD